MADGGDRELRATRFVAVKLGTLVESVLMDMQTWPRFSFNLRRRYRMEGVLEVGVKMYADWQEEFG